MPSESATQLPLVQVYLSALGGAGAGAWQSCWHVFRSMPSESATQLPFVQLYLSALGGAGGTGAGAEPQHAWHADASSFRHDPPVVALIAQHAAQSPVLELTHALHGTQSPVQHGSHAGTARQSAGGDGGVGAGGDGGAFCPGKSQHPRQSGEPSVVRHAPPVTGSLS